jgi:hypothetical protein
MGLVCIGLVGLAIFIILQANQAQNETVVPPTPVVIALIPTDTPTSTPSLTHTPTPPPTPTGTPVVNISGQEASSPETSQSPTETPGADQAEATATNTPEAPVPTEEPEITPTQTSMLPLPPTEGSEATSTSTLVLQTPTDEVTTTPTTAPGMPEGGGVLPANGNHFLVWFGVVLLLLLLLGVVNRLRVPSQTS